MKIRYTGLFLFISLLLFLPLPAISQEYVLVAWNDLGMHCANQDFSKIAVLPPFNNVNAQLILRQSDQPPLVVTSGYTLEYSIPNNTYSVGKTNFWTYAQQIFGLPAPLPDNIGLTGKGLTGVLDSAGNYFTAHGIPVTPFPDSDLVHENPFQLIHIVAKSKADGAVLASTDAVIPVSNEIGCVQSGCHTSETDIINSHDQVAGFNPNAPILCAGCHASPALGTTGNAEAGIFSMRIHGTHASVISDPYAIATCYKCHPGPRTQCLRDIMGRNPVNPLLCQNCHGTLDIIANSIQQGRKPWLEEPRCGNCHGNTYAEEPGKLFRQSEGHGGLFCSACHSSPHSILPSVQPNDNIQNIRLQGFAGTLKKCSVCHATTPSGPGPHGILDSVRTVPGTPPLASPMNGIRGSTRSPHLQWGVVPYAVAYRVQVSMDSLFGTTIIDDSTITNNYLDIGPLDSNTTFYWRVLAKNENGTSAWSVLWNFSTSSGAGFLCTFDNFWNLVSLPVVVENPMTSVQFPSAVSRAYQYVPGPGYVTPVTMQNGVGYWLKFRAVQSVTLTGTPFVTDTISVADGWNLIGTISSSVATSEITVLGTSFASEFFGYSHGYSSVSVLMPAKGYWIKVSNSGRLVFNSSSQVGKATAKSSFIEQLGKIIIKDASGSEQTLYFGKGPSEYFPAGRFDMPPAPPEGGFDARFSSGSFVEFSGETETREIPINISSETYPVTIRIIEPSTQPSADLILNGNLAAPGADGEITLTDRNSHIALRLGPVTASMLPEVYSLEQNYPNPFNPSTVISYQLPIESRVILKIYNVIGEIIGVPVNGVQPAGSKSITWNAKGCSSGIYFYRIEMTSTADPTKTFRQGRKMLLMK
jgi:hypothetical protein